MKLGSSTYVHAFQAKEGIGGSVVDPIAFPPQFAGSNVVILEAEAMVGMFEEIETVLGTGGSVIIQQQGVSYGRAMAAALASTLTRPCMIRNYRYGLHMLMATGWGIPSVLRANEDLTGAVVRIDECFECNGRKVKRGAGYFMAGYLAGVFSFLSGNEIRFTQTKCIAAGDDHCEFRLQTQM